MKAQTTQKSETRFEDVFQEQLEDLYDAEKQIVDALPKMVAQSSSEMLARALQEHLGETKEQVTRLEAIFERMGQQPGGRHCAGMEGLLTEGQQAISGMTKSAALDITIIAAAQKVEHYEISAYGSIRALGEMLGQQDVVAILQQTLEEEKNADEALTEVAESILGGDEIEEDDEEEEDGEDKA